MFLNCVRVATKSLFQSTVRHTGKFPSLTWSNKWRSIRLWRLVRPLLTKRRRDWRSKNVWWITNLETWQVLVASCTRERQKQNQCGCKIIIASQLEKRTSWVHSPYLRYAFHFKFLRQDAQESVKRYVANILWFTWCSIRPPESARQDVRTSISICHWQNNVVENEPMSEDEM